MDGSAIDRSWKARNLRPAQTRVSGVGPGVAGRLDRGGSTWGDRDLSEQDAERFRSGPGDRSASDPACIFEEAIGAIHRLLRRGAQA